MSSPFLASPCTLWSTCKSTATLLSLSLLRKLGALVDYRYYYASVLPSLFLYASPFAFFWNAVHLVVRGAGQQVVLLTSAQPFRLAGRSSSGALWLGRCVYSQTWGMECFLSLLLFLVQTTPAAPRFTTCTTGW
jgi:hypothetical protein